MPGYHSGMELKIKRASKTMKLPAGSSAVMRSDMSSLAAAKAFRVAAKAYTAEATQTRARAVETLAGEGILTREGRLAKRYAAKA